MSPAAESPADCRLSRCVCRWISSSPRIPCIVPDGEYISTPADEVDVPAWSLLAGVMSVSGGQRSIRLHRFRVAYTARVLGRSCDALDTFGRGFYEAKAASSRIHASTATWGPDGGSLSLCLFAREFDLLDINKIAPIHPMELRLDLAPSERITLSSLPDLPEKIEPRTPICPISAAGGLWAPYLTKRHGPCSLVMQLFDRNDKEWLEVGSIPVKRPPASANIQDYTIRPIQGYVVIGDTILLSLYPYHLFFTFNCYTRAWAEVVTTEAKRMYYTPIRERGVYVKEDDMIYFLCGGIVCAYKLFNDENSRQMLAPPTKIDCIVPYCDEGCGHLVHLSDGVMCAVWMSVNLHCNCDATHVLITTFRIKGGSGQRQFVPKGVEVLHSTCRKLNMLPSKPSESRYSFIFLQEYDELDRPPAKKKRWVPSMALQVTEVPASSYVVESSKMLSCCRQFLNESPSLTIAMCERSVIKKDRNRYLYIICQLPDCSPVYIIDILDGRLRCHDETLTSKSAMLTKYDVEDETEDETEDKTMDQPLPWHFFCDGTFIFAVPSTEDDSGYLCEMSSGFCGENKFTRPAGAVFHLVFCVGLKGIALSDNLRGVYHLNSRASEWILHDTVAPPCVQREVNFSGYVVLDKDTFMVSDADSNCCFMLNISDPDCAWKVVMPYAVYETSSEHQTSPLPSLMYGSAFLHGRSFFTSGYIYTCSDGGLAAYELIEHCGFRYLGHQIDLRFSWPKGWDVDRMCLVDVDEDISSGAIMFCVLQDDDICHPGYAKQPVCITTVQVKTERLHDGKLKPNKIGHVDMAMSFIELDGKVIRNCFVL